MLKKRDKLIFHCAEDMVFHVILITISQVLVIELIS